MLSEIYKIRLETCNPIDDLPLMAIPCDTTMVVRSMTPGTD
jgi:hypothetical protein